MTSPKHGMREAMDGIRDAIDAAGALSDGASDDISPSREKVSDCDPDALAGAALERQNDFGNGQRMLRHFGRDFVHVRDIGWMIWIETHFEAEGGGEAVSKLAHRTAERIHLEADHLDVTLAERATIEAASEAEAKPKDERDEGEKMLVNNAKSAREALGSRRSARRKFAVSSGNDTRSRAMMTAALPYASRCPSDMDADPLKLNLTNGTLVFSRKPDPDCPDPEIVRLVGACALKTHDRGDLITRVAPAAYDPEALCPRWNAFLERFQPNPSIRRYLQVYHGYALTGLTGEQALLFYYGTGANGKSTFMEAISRIMGPYAQTLNADAVTGDNQRRGDQATPEFARLPGARLVRVSELARGSPLKESLVKALTGGEPMLVRHLNKGFFEFRPTFKAAMSGNDLPQIGGVDIGIWRRMKLVPWEVMIPDDERRPMEDVLAEFEQERSGILNWLIEGALIYLSEGLRAPPEIRAATDHYKEDMDPVGNFIAACVEIVPQQPGWPEAREQARVVYEAFKSWCLANGVRPWTENAFGRVFPQKGFRRVNGRIREYCGLRLKDVPERPATPRDGDDR